MPRVMLTGPARDDLREIWRYIALENGAAADRLLDRIYELCSLYASLPEAGTAVDRWQAGLRCCSVGNYVIFFRHETDGMLVVRVLHGARNIEELFQE
jgi:toxin ParE1/3/4